VADHEDLDDYVWNSSEVTDIELNGNSITGNSTGVVTVAGSEVTITSAGNYRISGSLTDGQVIVDTNDKETVRLILNGVDISCSTSAPIYIEDAKKSL
jgi:glutamate synthase domain-containing protein 3